ncbi:unnamed protein product [Phytophthora fragariaefolia]|uniref:Unnamed protein product n=1 Tax=Phytophthora fragariaefolia TaxID=1490495 RepID=A0A9W6UBV3_9STRA|nr:unnamed protein product [Phytophthora fragariaefolia]
MAAVLEPVPLLARTCRACGAQSSPLWRADWCLRCWLRRERAELFDGEETRRRRLEKKQLQLQIHARAGQQTQAPEQQQQQQSETPPAAVILKFTREEIEAATKDKKKERKHSRKDKKKKKKHRRKRELADDSDSDGPTPIPSPAQMHGFVYADRAPDAYTAPQGSAFEADRSGTRRAEATALVGDTDPGTRDDADDHDYNDEEDTASTPARSSSRKRKSVQRAEPVVLAESPASASKKRKTSSSRTPRSTRAAASAPTAPVVVAVPAAPSAQKKRARTKKELARERELRALGQYCPVCSEVYEDDDQNTFVCCDSCELWVHGACDPSLTPYAVCSSFRLASVTNSWVFCCWQRADRSNGQYRGQVHLPALCWAVSVYW